MSGNELKKILISAALLTATTLSMAEEQTQTTPKNDENFNGVRVTHVPEFVRDQIRDEVRLGLQEDVMNAVMSQAKNEGWGVPNAWPTWLNRVTVSSDFRFRFESERYGSNNADGRSDTVSYADYNRINSKGKFDVSDPDFFLNTQKNRERMRLRARLGFKTKISETASSEIRFATGNTGTPVSTNQTLGDDFNKYSITVDRASFVWKDVDLDGYPWLDVMVGRFKNPFLTTDLIWDSDINPDGLAATWRYNLSGGDDLFSMDQRDKTLYATAGLFPLDEFELSGQDRWLLGSQIGTEFILIDQTTMNFGLAVYNFINMPGERNTLGDDALDFTAPNYLGRGNTLFNITNSTDPLARKYAYAADYQLLNLTARFDITSFAPERLILDLDFVKNLGFDKDEVAARVVSGGDAADLIKDATAGYQAQVLYGWPDITHYRDWNIGFAYKYLEADAVVAAYTDSDFHGGGTDAQGWILSGAYGIEENTSINLKYLSATEIDGPKLQISQLQIDLNTRF